MSEYINSALLIYPPHKEELTERVRLFAAQHGIRIKLFSQSEFFSEPGRCIDYAEHVVAICDDSTISEFIDHAKVLNYSLGIVSTSTRNRINTWFQMPKKITEMLAVAFRADAKPIDVLRCNNEVVIGMVMVGDTPFLDQRSKAYIRRKENLWGQIIYWFTLLRVSIKNLSVIKPFAINIETGKGKTIATAITGMVAIENDVHSAAGKLINTSLSVQDGQVSTILIAPKSISEYLAFLITALRSKNKPVNKLPSAVSYIKSQQLTITSHNEIDYYIDGKRRSSNTIELELYPSATRINVSAEYTSRNTTAAKAKQRKDTVRLDNLPVNETRIEMIQSHLSLFTRALEDDFKDLFKILRESARSSPNYVVMMILSVIIATFGLFLSSAAVIIGAMVIAPLMAPITSLSMSVLRRDMPLLKTSSLTILTGTGLALATSSFLAMIIPIEKVTAEMAGRLQPNLLDLGIAIASGAAGAYAHARESRMQSMPGVAIAVALVPPLSVAGIGLGWMDWSVFSGAMLLFLTNLFGISIASSLTFLVLGYSPIVRAKKGLAVTSAILIIITIPLSISFSDMYQRWNLERLVAHKTFQVNDKELELINPKVSLKKRRVILRTEGSSAKVITFEDMEILKEKLETLYDRKVSLELLPRLSL